MSNIEPATAEQAGRLFEIMVKATEVGCAPCYPAEAIEIWNKGRSAAGMAGVIVKGQLYALEDDGVIRGFVEFSDAEVIGLFVHPDDQRKRYGSALFHYAVDQLGTRPIVVKATLNAVPFYLKLGCRKVATESVRRHDRDIYVESMEWV